MKGTITLQPLRKEKYNAEGWPIFDTENAWFGLVEFEEELGIKVQEEELKYVCDYLNEDMKTWRHVFYIESDQDKSEMKLTEGADFDWIPLDKVFAYDLTEKTKRDLKTFIRLRH